MGGCFACTAFGAQGRAWQGGLLWGMLAVLARIAMSQLREESFDTPYFMYYDVFFFAFGLLVEKKIGQADCFVRTVLASPTTLFRSCFG